MLTFMAHLSNGRGKSRGPINSPRPPKFPQNEQSQGLDVKHYGIILSLVFLWVFFPPFLLLLDPSLSCGLIIFNIAS